MKKLEQSEYFYEALKIFQNDIFLHGGINDSGSFQTSRHSTFYWHKEARSNAPTCSDNEFSQRSSP